MIERWFGRTALSVALGLAALALVGLASIPVIGRTTGSAGDQVDHIFAPWDRATSPGCAVAVIKDGAILYKRGYGVADLDHNIPITPATVFHAASLSKQFTAMSIMLLVGQHRLSLEDDVRQYIPKFPLAGVTVGDMLRHISGIRDQWALVTMAGWRLSDDVVTRDDVLDLVRRMNTPNFKPRSDIAYSNTNYTLAGLIVERVTNRSLADFARDNIFVPLGMKNTMFADTHGMLAHNRAYGYRPVAGQSFELRMPNYDLTGPTNLLTTVEDLARWERNFDDKTVGGDAALSAMQSPAILADGTPAVLTKDDDGDVHYGLGLALSTYRGLRVVEHNGRDAGYRADLMRFPAQHFGVVCLCNLALEGQDLPSVLARRVADVYLGDQLVSRPNAQFRAASTPQRSRPATAAADLSEYTGRYHSDEIDSTYTVERHGSSLRITRQKYEPTDLEPGDHDVFNGSRFSAVLSAVTVTFTRDSGGHVTGFLMDDPNEARIQNFKFEKLH